MSFCVEIYRAFFVALGAMETIMNLKYLTGENGMELARKQHGELPKNLPDSNIRVKVCMMLFSGIAFLITGILSFVFHSQLRNGYLVVLGCFALYACVEAGYYRFRNTFGFAAVSCVAFAIYFFLC